MNARFTRQSRAALGVLLATAAFSACSSDEQPPLGSTGGGGQFAVGVDLSSGNAAPGERIALALRADNSSEELGVLQGTLKFDPSRLTYVGQAPEGTKVTMVNSSRAAQGELRLLSVSPAGIGNQSGTLVFTVAGAAYHRGLSFNLELASDRAGKREIVTARQGEVLPAEGLVVPASARAMALADWNEALYPGLSAREATERKAAARQGRLVTISNERFGNINLSTETGFCGVDAPGGASSVNGLDALFIANISVGNNTVLDTLPSGAVSPNGRDPILVGNVAPASSNPVGINSNGARKIDGLDALAVAQENVGISHPVVCAPVVFNTPGGAATTISGSIINDTTWTAGSVVRLDGIVRVTGGASLTIQPGVRVEGLKVSTPGTPSALYIERDGRINAVGTPQSPIVFTCDVTPKTKGCWGGVVIAGNSTTNGGQGSAAVTANDSPVITGRTTTSGCTAQNYEGSEITPATLVRFGGCNDADSSGVVKFARFEYGGYQFQANKELNNFTLGGVGSKTVIDFIQVHGGNDDGLEIFGGSVNIRHLVATANSDDAFDLSQSWHGTAQFIIIQQDTADADKGFEIDNTESPQSLSLTPLTDGPVANVTMIGKQSFSANTGPITTNDVEGGIMLRRGANNKHLINMIMMGFRFIMDLDDAVSGSPTCNADILTAVQWKGVVVADYGTLDDTDNETLCPPFLNIGAPASSIEDDWFNTAGLSHTIVTGGGAAILKAPYDRVNPDFLPVTAAAVSGGVAIPTGFGFDASATYLGAVDPAGNAIPWYMPWSRAFTNATTP